MVAKTIEQASKKLTSRRQGGSCLNKLRQLEVQGSSDYLRNSGKLLETQQRRQKDDCKVSNFGVVYFFYLHPVRKVILGQVTNYTRNYCRTDKYFRRQQRLP